MERERLDLRWYELGALHRMLSSTYIGHAVILPSLSKTHSIFGMTRILLHVMTVTRIAAFFLRTSKKKMTASPTKRDLRSSMIHSLAYNL